MTGFDYGWELNLGEVSFDRIQAEVVEALKGEGFGVLTEIDVLSTLKMKLDLEFRRYTILGACNPSLASKALWQEPQIGLLLPCNVVIQQNDLGEVVVSIADPNAMFRIVDNPEVEPVAREAATRLQNALESIREAA